MKRIMIAAMNSGSGKTVVTCALLRALAKRGLSVEAFKCGPDYIDPMFHTRVLNTPCRNLDLFLQGESGLRRTLEKQRAEVALLEGAMGFYDGVNGTPEASAWQVAERTQTPVVLVVRPKGTSVTLAAQIRGLVDFRPDSQIVGILLNDCKPTLYAHLKPILERETGLAVLGCLPPLEEARLESRHLGLVTAAEVREFQSRFDRLAAQLDHSADLDKLLSLAAEVEPPPEQKREPAPERCVIAVARDKAFCFYYEDNLDALREAGARLAFFSPLRDSALPEADGLYLGGGYPELYAGELSENTALREELLRQISGGMPTLAECGGFLYLKKTLRDEAGRSVPMVGALPGEGYPTQGLRRFGYLRLSAEEETMLFRPGEHIPAHEFHYWDCTENGDRFRAEKPSGAAWRCGYGTKTLYAAFPHLHFNGAFPLAERFVAAAAAHRKERL